jgi:hypothetical protein
MYGDLVISDDILQPQSESNTGSNVYLIQEMEKQGRMNLFVTVAGECLKIANLSRHKDFTVLKNKRCADCILWEKMGNKCYRLHLFEMKMTMDTNNWAKVKAQYHGAFLRSLMITGLLGVSIDPCIHLHTVFHRDKFSSDEQNNTDPAMERIPTDEEPAELEWRNDRWNFLSYGRSPHWEEWGFRHHKIELRMNDNGIPEGKYDLNQHDIIL